MPHPSPPPDRRAFVRSLGRGGAALGALVALGGTGALLQACAGIGQAPYRREGDDLVVDTEALDPAGMALLDHPEGGAPILLARLSSGGFAAVLTRCPRDGCRLEPEDDRLVCPCGGSTFALSGRALAGPARGDLVAWPVSVRDDGTVVVGWRPGPDPGGSGQ